MKPLSERDENEIAPVKYIYTVFIVGMKPLSERDENAQVYLLDLEGYHFL